MLCREEQGGPLSEIIRKTSIIYVICEILQAEAMEEEYFYLKLESLWILINLAIVTGGLEKLMLISELEKDDLLLWDDPKMINEDLNKKRSPLLHGINQILVSELNNNKDMTQNAHWKDMLAHTLFFVSNLIAEERLVAYKVLDETKLVDILQVSLNLEMEVEMDIFSHMVHICKHLATHCSKPNSRKKQLDQEQTEVII